MRPRVLPRGRQGTGATLLRDVPGSYAYFAAYEYSKRELASSTARHAASMPSCALRLTPRRATWCIRSLAAGDGKLNPAATLFSGAMAGVFNWLVALPADTLKSRYQSAPEGTYKNGIRDVFAGAPPWDDARTQGLECLRADRNSTRRPRNPVPRAWQR